MSQDKVSTEVSVIIPCFNAERWVAQAIDSALAQGLPGLEVVVVNDGSTDRTHEIAERYGQRIVLIDQENGGVSRARREGIRKANGRYIKFLDADDVLPAGALASLLEVVETFPRGAILGRCVAVDVDGYLFDEGMYDLPIRSEHRALVPPEFLLTQPTSSGLWLFPREEIDDSFFDEATQLGEEYIFCMALIDKRIPVFACDVVVHHMRVHDSPTRLSRSRREADHLRQAELIRMTVEIIAKKLPDHSPLALQHIARLSWSRGRDCLRIGCRRAASAYFLLAKEVDPDLQPVGSLMYQTVCRLSGPVAAEQILGGIKRLLGQRSAI